MKIFKYTVKRNDSRYFINAPKNIKIIRMGHVDDGFYKGDFVWGIVNPEDEQVLQYIDYVDENLDVIPRTNRTQLSVKEKQEIICTTPIAAKDIDGILYLFHPLSGEVKKHKIVFYKTGQEIDEPIENLKYLGLCRLWIMQELGLYAFLVSK